MVWNGYRIAYICAVFFGRPDVYGGHRSEASKVACFSDSYLPALRKHATCIDKVILVCNLRPSSDEEHFLALKDKAAAFEEETGMSVEVCSRPNQHYSYGAWNMALQDLCEDIDFAFLMEDDYLFCKPGFDEELLSRYYSTVVDTVSVLFCVSHWQSEPDHRNLDPHASISNGLINVALFKKYGGSFHLPAKFANNGVNCQLSFLKAFADKGLKICSMSPDYCMPFAKNAPTGTTNGFIFVGCKRDGGKSLTIMSSSSESSPRPMVIVPALLDEEVIRRHQERVSLDDNLEETQVFHMTPLSSAGFTVLEGRDAAR